MASSLARLRHEFAQGVGDAIAWRVGVKGARTNLPSGSMT